MTIPVIISLCTLLLIAYVFDITASKTKIPSVILLLLLGWGVKQFTAALGIPLPDLSLFLPIFGTVGLILIVLEGSLELDLDKSKVNLVTKSFTVALVPMIILSITLAYAFSYFGQVPFKIALINAIPFCIVSSAIAIPSVKHLKSLDKEFIIYESSFSDIIGVLFFNFIALNEFIGLHSFRNFVLDLLIILAVSYLATLGLSFLLKKIDHHIKFTPIIICIIIIYAISKIYHLPALIFILLFGLFLGNIDKLKHIKIVKKIQPDGLKEEVHRFKEILIELAFLIRAFFFLLFGYSIKLSEILNLEALMWSLGIVAGIFVLRLIILKIAKLPVKLLFFVAPRGLITILLFLAITAEQSISFINKAVIIQVILMTALFMMVGLMINKTEDNSLTINEDK